MQWITNYINNTLNLKLRSKTNITSDLLKIHTSLIYNNNPFYSDVQFQKEHYANSWNEYHVLKSFISFIFSLPSQLLFPLHNFLFVFFSFFIFSSFLLFNASIKISAWPSVGWKIDFISFRRSTFPSLSRRLGTGWAISSPSENIGPLFYMSIDNNPDLRNLKFS